MKYYIMRQKEPKEDPDALKLLHVLWSHNLITSEMTMTWHNKLKQIFTYLCPMII